MQERYDFSEVEPRIAQLWEEYRCFAPRQSNKRPFSMFLIPPNASGPLHIGNALMLAIQDVLARYHRAQGEPTLWVPGTDHGGYETQVTFERELEARGKSKDDYTRAELYDAISHFVEENNEIIKNQIKAMGASVDWSKFRYTLDDASLRFVEDLFKKMVRDHLIYRGSYMVNYCPTCATMLADIELKEARSTTPLYFIRFPFASGEGSLVLATPKPEFLFSITHVLVHPEDNRFADYIGIRLINPSTGAEVAVIESKRKFDPEHTGSYLSAFMPSASKYDFEYAIRHKLPSRNLLDWEGRLLERHPGATPDEARVKELEHLARVGAIDRNEEGREPLYFCKKGHQVCTVIRMSWFLRLDDVYHPLRAPALDSIAKEHLALYPQWRLKGLVEWLGKMHEWPISRQNVWGIRMPLFYEVVDPSLFIVWFIDRQGKQRFGRLSSFFAEGIRLDEVREGLERIYAEEGAPWTIEPTPGKDYLPETDTFDTWFSSSAWGSIVFDPAVAPGLERFYPSSVTVIGYDLLRLSIARKILLSRYLSGRLPMRKVFFHQLLRSEDGQKMSKSLGNAVWLGDFMSQFGADVTRMALVSYSSSSQDFFFDPKRLRFYRHFVNRLWAMGRVCALAHGQGAEDLSAAEQALYSGVGDLRTAVAHKLERYQLASAQEAAVAFLVKCEEYVNSLKSNAEAARAVAVLFEVCEQYLEVLHPFMPFMTEELYRELYRSRSPLASVVAKK